jgi:hypothetical protein
MAQSRRMSAVEAATNTFGGFVVALGCQVTIFPWFGVHIALASSAGIALIMMVQSLVRQYLFRRFFAWLERREERRRGAPTPESLMAMFATEEQLARLTQS